VTGEARPDPSAPGEDWSVVDFAPVQALTAPVTLAQVRAMPALAEMALLKRSRLSVAPVTASEWKVILAAARTKL
jgi:predicted RNA-binding protein with PUA-like domain